MTRPPAASMRAAAAITSTTMNGGTSLRREGVIRPLAASNIGGFLLPRHGKYPRPAVAVFGGFRAASPKGAPARYQLDGAGAMGRGLSRMFRESGHRFSEQNMRKSRGGARLN